MRFYEYDPDSLSKLGDRNINLIIKSLKILKS